MTLRWSRGALALILFLTACGGDGTPVGDVTPPTERVATPASGSTIDSMETISILFSETMDRASLALTGTLAAFSDGGVWSTVNTEDDTLTVNALTVWPTGGGETLIVNATDLAGNPLAQLSLMYDIPLMVNTFQAASVVIGQADFTSGEANQDEVDPDANTLSGPSGAPSHNGFHQPDADNNRVLIYNNPPAANDANAERVLGQADFTQDDPGTSDSAMTGPTRAEVAGSSLFVLDSGNHRVMQWLTLPTLNNAPADHVHGQADFIFNAAGTSQTRLSSPKGLSVVEVGSEMRMVVGDTGNNRVMIWNPVPASDGSPATVVLGQTDFDTRTVGVSATEMNAPTGVWTDGTRIAVADSGNNRVLIWNTFPVTNGAPADIVVGQPDFTTSTGASGAQGLRRPAGVSSNRLSLFVADTNNSRVLVFDMFPTMNQPMADVVLGQADFVTQLGATTQQGLNLPMGVRAIGDRLYVSDTGNNRVMVFDGQ